MIIRIPEESGLSGLITTKSLSLTLKTPVANATYAGLFIKVATNKVPTTRLLPKKVDVLSSLEVLS